MKSFDIGIAGMGVMGQNLARNLMDKQFSVLVYNRHVKKTMDFVKAHAVEGEVKVNYTETLKELAQGLARPRKIPVEQIFLKKVSWLPPW